MNSEVTVATGNICQEFFLGILISCVLVGVVEAPSARGHAGHLSVPSLDTFVHLCFFFSSGKQVGFFCNVFTDSQVSPKDLTQQHPRAHYGQLFHTCQLDCKYVVI